MELLKPLIILKKINWEKNGKSGTVLDDPLLLSRIILLY